MNAPIYITPSLSSSLPKPPAAGEAVQLLRQLVDLQEEQLGLLRTHAAGQDSNNRWRAFLSRWAEEFPDIGIACKETLPVLERAYLTLVREVTDRVNATETGELENEFALGEFLDRFGVRLAQLGNILGQLGPLADAVPASSESDAT